MADQRRDEREDRRRRFAAAFRKLLESHGLSQTAFAEQYGVAASTVNQWAMGRSVPEPDVVFDIERRFGLRPGGLSETLGYLPVQVLTATIEGTEAAIRTDPLLPAWGKEVLIVSYREMLNWRGGSRRPG